MPPKRRVSGPVTKSSQSTLAFHGASNKVTKPSTRVASGKNSALAHVLKKKDVTPEEVTELIDEPRPAEAALSGQTKKEVVEQSTPEEEQARRIPDAAMQKYWAAKEKQRMAPRVHQAELSVHEKILREFDMSAQYGPCTGIARLKRWKRAYGIGLDPPLEVLAVVLKEMDQDSSAAAM
ncbi:hypothetical protein ACEQ8H_006460 [Pleosporales sp. CAS-2024a]